jgi:GT2 family glycosyltransferase
MIISATRNGESRYSLNIPSEFRGGWCRVVLRVPRDLASTAIQIRSVAGSDDMDADVYYLTEGKSLTGSARRTSIMYIPGSARDMDIEFFGDSIEIEFFSIEVVKLKKWTSGIMVALGNPIRLLSALRGGRQGIGIRVRATMAMLATGKPPSSYQLWIKKFDNWTVQQHACLMQSDRRDSWPKISVYVFCGPKPSYNDPASPALRSTLNSIERQLLRVPVHLIGEVAPGMALSEAVPATDTEYVALLQAGEVLPVHALAMLAEWITGLGRPDAVYADEDLISSETIRHSPLFKPQPNRSLMMSGTLTSGVWLVRRECLLECSDRDGYWAESLRLDIWLRLHEHDGARGTYRVPHIATHRRGDCRSAPPPILAKVVQSHLKRISLDAQVSVTWPLRVQLPIPRDRAPQVSIIVPSACRSKHVLRCIQSVSSKTDYDCFEIVIIVSQNKPLDSQQSNIIGELSKIPRVRIIFDEIEGGFNFAVANNHASEQTEGPLICLLNDDVEPIGPDWLANMVGHLQDPAVGVVGAKLYYPNNTVQHGGVIIGLAGLCDHVNRFLPRGAPGYAWRGVLDQELSAVTAACLLIRREVYAAVGGMDSRYESAFNDVDLCLKARAAGWSVVFSAQAELIHYESLSYGQHYSDDEVHRWERDVALMRSRWSAVVADDPFHNPNLSLQRGHEWELAFPPRAARLLGYSASVETPAPD